MNTAIDQPAPPTIEQRVVEWWRGSLSCGDRGNSARLRRCHSPLDAVTIPVALSLARRLGRVPRPTDPVWKHRGFERVLGLAVVLASVEKNTEIPLLRSLGWDQFPYDKKETDVAVGRPTLSELRFKHLLQAEREDELIAAFTRLLRLVRGETSVSDLARVYLRWDEERTKRDLALTYYHATTRGLDTND